MPRALTSLPRGIHLLVLDAWSRDHTLQFARAVGARVIQREWTDFVDARRFALANVDTPWTLMIDADEALDDVLRDAIVQVSDAPDGYVVRRTTYFRGKPMRIWKNEPLLRLFRTGRATLKANPAAGSSAPLHEAWSCDGDVADLPGTLLHYSYPDAPSYRAKYEQYTTLEANRLRGSLAAFLLAVLAGVPRLLWLLVGKGALLDGPRGWYVAFWSALYPAVATGKALAGKPGTA